MYVYVYMYIWFYVYVCQYIFDDIISYDFLVKILY